MTDAQFQEKMTELLTNKITILELNVKEFSETQIQEFATALENNTSLVHLEVWNTIVVTGVNHLARALKNNTTLQILVLRCNALGEKGIFQIATALQDNTTLKSLTLDGNDMGDTGATHIARVLRSNSSLEILELGGNKIGPIGITEIVAALQANTSTSLRYLCLSHNPIGNDGVAPIAALLRGNTPLQSLDIKAVKIDVDHFSGIVNALVDNTSLQNFDFVFESSNNTSSQSYRYNLASEDRTKNYLSSLIAKTLDRNRKCDPAQKIYSSGIGMLVACARAMNRMTNGEYQTSATASASTAAAASPATAVTTKTATMTTASSAASAASSASGTATTTATNNKDIKEKVEMGTVKVNPKIHSLTASILPLIPYIQTLAGLREPTFRHQLGGSIVPNPTAKPKSQDAIDKLFGQKDPSKAYVSSTVNNSSNANDSSADNAAKADEAKKANLNIKK